MIWDTTTPTDLTQFNVAATTDFHNAKQMVRERAVAWNGTIYEHKTNTDASFGVHEASKVSWLKWHDTYTDMELFCSPITAYTGTLHYVRNGAEAGLYTVRNSAFIRNSVIDHSELVITTPEDDHPQYIEKVKNYPGTSNPIAYIESSPTLNATSLAFSAVDGDAALVPESHNDEAFDIAHETFELAQVDDDSLTLDLRPSSIESTTYSAVSSSYVFFRVIFWDNYPSFSRPQIGTVVSNIPAAGYT